MRSRLLRSTTPTNKYINTCPGNELIEGISSSGRRERERERPFDEMTLDQLTPHLYFFSKLQMKSLKKRGEDGTMLHT